MRTTSSSMKQNLKRVLAGAGLAIALPMAAFAQPAPGADGPGAMPPAQHRFHGGPGGPGMYEGGRHHGRGHGMAFLRGIQLTDAQKDKVFAIRHALAPQMYEKFKIVRKSHEELRGAATSATFDEARAKAAIDAGARAKADIAFMKLRAEREVFSLLSPEQKAQVERNRANFLQHRMSQGERGGPRAPGGSGAPQK